MPVNGMSVGKDYEYSYYDPYTGQVIDFGDVESVHVTNLKHSIKAMPYNRTPRYGFIPDGHSIRIGCARTNPNVENLQLDANKRFNDGGEILPGYLTETVRERGGQISRYQYPEAVIWVGDPGDVRRDANVKQSIEIMVGDKVRIA